MTASRKDILPATVPDLKWDSASALSSIKQVLAYASNHADEAINWYLKAKKAKRIWARLLRLGAILFTAAAGILPVLTQIMQTAEGKAALAPAWASVLLAVAILFIAIDRFFGFSTAWMRYISAELKLKQLKEGFEIDTQAVLASLQGQPPTHDQIQAILAFVKAFMEKVNAVIVSETAQWVDEFREALKQIDEGARAQAVVAEAGSIQLVVENGDQADAGWSLSVDNAPPARHTGKTAALIGLLVGDHALRVSATIGGKAVRGESVACVRAGSVAAVELSMK